MLQGFEAPDEAASNNKCNGGKECVESRPGYARHFADRSGRRIYGFEKYKQTGASLSVSFLERLSTRKEIHYSQ